jgi:hypothetical protein
VVRRQYHHLGSSSIHPHCLSCHHSLPLTTFQPSEIIRSFQSAILSARDHQPLGGRVLESVDVAVSTSPGLGLPTLIASSMPISTSTSATITSSSASTTVIEGSASPNLLRFLSNFHRPALRPSYVSSHSPTSSLVPSHTPARSLTDPRGNAERLLSRGRRKMTSGNPLPWSV